MKHGHAGRRAESPEYRAWQAMLERCANPKRRDYKHYGGRGIKVCDRWRQSFPAFLADMGAKPSQRHELDRRDSNGDYGPDNCRWATRLEQARNTRVTVYLEHEGIRRSIGEWAELTGLRTDTLLSRVKRGWPTARALDPKPASRWSPGRCA